VLEDVDNNPFISRFYEDPDQYSFPAQLYFLLTRYNQQRELSQQDLFSQMTVADYLFAKDRIFATLNLAPDELKLYERVYQLLNAEMAKPDLVIYVRARVEVLAERLRKRNRDFERDISFEYLERVSAAYRDFFFYYDEAPLLVVDTSDIDFVANPEDLADLVREINHAGEGTQHFVPRKS
jgi:deoxyadenosine/deoxycytidine kinase